MSDSPAIKELLRIHQERRKLIPDHVFRALEGAAKIERLTSPDISQLNQYKALNVSSLFEEHTKNLRGIEDAVKRAMAYEGIANKKVFEAASGQLNGIAIKSLLEGPKLGDIAKFIQPDIQKTFGAAVAGFLPNQKETLSAISALQVKWPGPLISQHSIEGLTGLMSLSKAIDTTSPARRSSRRF
jgi:hypothetical protein